MAGFTITGPADEYAELQQLTQQLGGRVTPEAVLDQARNPESTFHAHITWDEGEAARKFQLQQAAGIIRKFKVVREEGGRMITVPSFVRVGDSQNGYAPVESVIGVDWVVQQRRIQLIDRLNRLAEELRNWDEFADLANAIVEATKAA